MECGTSVFSESGLTSGHTVETNIDSRGLHSEAAGQAAQHRLNRVASGLMAVDDHLPPHLRRFKPHAALCKGVKLVDQLLMDSGFIIMCYGLFRNNLQFDCVSHRCSPCSS